MSHRQRLFMRHLILLILTMTLTLLGCNTTTRMTTSASLQTSDIMSLPERNYSQLNNALPFYQDAVNNPWPTISEHKTLKLGSKNAMVPILRERLKRSGDLPELNDNSSTLFDSVLVQAVKSFQMRHGLKPDGMMGETTRAELNIPPGERVKQIQASMQRWATLSNKLGNRYLIVNIPDYQMYIIENNQKVLSMKAIVGKPERPTPELYSHITRLVFNPYWHVPTKIAKNDILPKVQEDPKYLDNMNIKVVEHDNDKPMDENNINWDDMDQEQDLSFDFRQDPGDKNALGIVKFEFPNAYAVYMHDTPAKNLFDAYPRDFSSGCIRIEKPLDLVNYLIKDNPDWNDEKIQTVIKSKKTTYVTVIKPIPIVITYITAWVDENGKVNFRDDVYTNQS